MTGVGTSWEDTYDRVPTGRTREGVCEAMTYHLTAGRLNPSVAHTIPGHRTFSDRAVDVYTPHPDDVARATRAYEQLAASLAPPARVAAAAYWAALSSAHWALEWNLARWLGAPLGLPAALQGKLARCSGLVLAALRLLDDLADGELESSAVWLPFAEALLEGSLGTLRRSIPEDDPFWANVQHELGAWRAEQRRGGFSTPSPAADAGRLAAPGRPLLLAAGAVYRLAGAGLPTVGLTEALQAYLAASVLLDHWKDWPRDLAGGRPNLFVSSLLGPVQPKSPALTKAHLWTAIAWRKPYQKYGERIEAELQRAARLSRAEGFDKLAGYLAALRSDVQQQVHAMRASARAGLGLIERHIFDPDGTPTEAPT